MLCAADLQDLVAEGTKLGIRLERLQQAQKVLDAANNWVKAAGKEGRGGEGGMAWLVRSRATRAPTRHQGETNCYMMSSSPSVQAAV